ncbi:beta-1,4-galactosyltransferase 6-like [Haliotis asinina]|uniref:beta-1,4-galactosyltransferase 6-like n=1 Tax=Haliotis asinina TaxID=109174 RepID=UPI003531DFD1
MFKKAIRMVIIVSGVLNFILLGQNVFNGIQYVTKSGSGHSWDEFDRVLKRNYSNHHLFHLPRCPDLPTVTEWLRRPNVSKIDHGALTREYFFGVDGHFSPPNCVTDERTAVIIPSDDPDNVRILLNNLIPVLRNQNKDFTIFVVEQASGTPSNKALLMNAGFVEAVRQDIFTCVVFHDVDLIPVTNTVPYRCLKSHPHYLSVTTSNFNSTAREHRLGGVVAMTPQLFKSVNGFSNLYFGNGYEDRDMFQRLKSLNISTVDARGRDGIFFSRGDAGHRTKSHDEDGLKLLDEACARAEQEGLNTLKASLNAQYSDGNDGHFTAQGCAGRDKTAIIIPFRDRHQNLTILLNNLIPILRKRNVDFTIFVIEQDLDTTFNKAIMMNAGFKEAMKQDYFTCFIFHDVDYIPETENVPYECLLNRSYHLAAAVSAFNYTCDFSRRRVLAWFCCWSRDPGHDDLTKLLTFCSIRDKPVSRTRTCLGIYDTGPPITVSNQLTSREMNTKT